MRSLLGTSSYMAPEMLLGRQYTSKVDVFSFAILMFSVLTGEFDPYNQDSMQYEFVEFKVAHDPHFRPDLALLPREVPRGLHWVIGVSWDHDPIRRPTFQQISEILEAERIRVEATRKKQKIVVYLRTEEMDDNDADDNYLEERTMESLLSVVKEYCPSFSQGWKIMLEGTREVDHELL